MRNILAVRPFKQRGNLKKSSKDTMPGKQGSSRPRRKRVTRARVRKKDRTSGKSRAQPIGSLDAFIDGSARALDLSLEPVWRAAVKTNLDVILRLASQFSDFPLPDDAEPAPVFVA